MNTRIDSSRATRVPSITTLAGWICRARRPIPPRTSAGKPDLHYEVDDFTDPWKHAPVIILQHGFGRSSNLWYRWVPYLSRFFKVVRPNLRGFGGSLAITATTSRNYFTPPQATAFVRLAALQSKAMGHPDLAVVLVEHPLGGLEPDEVREKAQVAAKATVDRLLDAWFGNIARVLDPAGIDDAADHMFIVRGNSPT